MKKKFFRLLRNFDKGTAFCSSFQHACSFKQFKEFETFCNENKEICIPWYAEYICRHPSMNLFIHFSYLAEVEIPKTKIPSSEIIAFKVHEVWFSIIALGISKGYFSREKVFNKFFINYNKEKRNQRIEELKKFLDDCGI